MKKLFWCWIWMIWVAGCNLPTAAQPVVTPSVILTLPASATLPFTFTPMPTFTPTFTSEAQLAPTTSSPSETPTWTVPVIPTTQQVVTPPTNSFQGSVLLQGGICCLGGVVGTEVKLRKDFAAKSPFGSVTEMRLKEGMFCFSEAEMADASWEPFSASVTEPFAITAINWVGHYLSVQYRDSLGNLSPVFCDDISVEGMPALSTPG
jgi:hypothetical protein